MVTVILIPTIEEQREDPARNSIIDPAGVGLERGPISVMVGYEYNRGLIGMATNLRLEEGRVVADLDIKVGWSGNVVESHRDGDVTVIDRFDLLSVNLEPAAARAR